MSAARRWSLGILLGLGLPPAASAQAPITAGVVGGSLELPGGGTQSDLNGILKFLPVPWFSVTGTVSALRVSAPAPGGDLTSSGIGDLPLSFAVAAPVHARWTPELGAALDVTLPTGDPAQGLGSGSTTVGADLGLGVTPHPGIAVYLGASREFSGNGGLSALTSSRTTSLSLDGEYAFAPRWRSELSFSGEFGTPDSGAALHRTLGVGIARQLRGPLEFTVDLGHGLTAASPGWAVALGFGAVFGGNNPVSAALSSHRLAHAVSAGVGRGQGHGHVGGPP